MSTHSRGVVSKVHLVILAVAAAVFGWLWNVSLGVGKGEAKWSEHWSTPCSAGSLTHQSTTKLLENLESIMRVS